MEIQLISLIIPSIVFLALLWSRINFHIDRYKKLLSQKKSSEVILGGITEQLSPFLKDFPVSKEECQNLNFLGMPIDYIHFGEDEILFIEVKSGNSRLSKKQRHIRDLISDGKVKFTVFRVN